ncbi:hypothetical protein K503DRAFT_777311 [Rhizopogon vinicolor AM-OR11-026]|uniref:Uncharacterized protein n=1 Tax=Rhizopogon vinicolor AM-OR11-026 TaxID=1314800 RepID=A0A1B7MGP2_9AGAM|nr:hypothetical protein K503DRAFT_777311 [Rhizopogon vinicolor AM-OR11-026]
MLYNEPYFVNCWGYSKRVYRGFPMSPIEADLERDVLAALEAVPLDAIRRFSTRSLRFMGAYRRGLMESRQRGLRSNIKVTMCFRRLYWLT